MTDRILITVNGREIVVDGGIKLDYAKVFGLAFPGRRPIPGASIVYWCKNGDDVTSSGSIAGDHFVYPKIGMVFDCAFTWVA